MKSVKSHSESLDSVRDSLDQVESVKSHSQSLESVRGRVE